LLNKPGRPMVATTSNTIANARRLHRVIKFSCPKMDAGMDTKIDSVRANRKYWQLWTLIRRPQLLSRVPRHDPPFSVP
jgi:hypothetical protein